jgi:predicted AAA+ superfamily ATPase
VEVACGAHLFHECRRLGGKLFWWREGDDEVDFVAKLGKRLVAVEIKSGRDRGHQSGLRRFQREYAGSETLLVGGGGEKLEAFLARPFA